MTVLVTGGAGFIGSNFVLDWLAAGGEPVANLAAPTYAGNVHNLASLAGEGRHVFVKGDIGDRALVDRLLAELAMADGVMALRLRAQLELQERLLAAVYERTGQGVLADVLWDVAPTYDRYC